MFSTKAGNVHRADMTTQRSGQRIELGEHMVADPLICHGKPTYHGTRIMVWQVLAMLERGEGWAYIRNAWRGRVSDQAIAETIHLARASLLDKSGRELKKVKQGAGPDPVLDFTAPADGAYTIKLYDEIYGGGNDYFYRLTASAAPFVDFVFPASAPAGTTAQFTLYGRNLPGGKPADGLTAGGLPLEKLPVNVSLPAEETAKTSPD